MAGAILGAGASILGGIFGGKGAADAARAQAQAQQQALAVQQQEFQTNQANFAPYIAAGTGALGGQQTLLGLNGNAAQQSAIDALKAGPQFTSQYNTGLDAINQNAAATGGLRGGNNALAESNFGSSLLGTVIQNQLSGLGGLSSMGAGAAQSAGNLGQNNVNAQTGIYNNIGNANATAALAPYGALSGTFQGLGRSGIFNTFGGGQVGGGQFGGNTPGIDLSGANPFSNLPGQLPVPYSTLPPVKF